uniref:Uncharacterized protein n=1 Tax=viral metagenome TaxID=1070528 RepID=A0A6M3IKS4_9ZZZZ
MREYELVIDNSIKKGLTPQRSFPINDEWLWGALGFRVGKDDLEGYQLSDNSPLGGLVDMHYNWPFPQFIVGEAYNILVVRDNILTKDAVYQVSDDYATITLIHDIDQLTYGQGTLMEAADFGEYIFMTNGVVMIYWDPTLAAWQNMTVSATIPMMRTVCNFKGQMIGGGVLSVWHDCDETFYCWSKIGDVDFTPDRDNEAGYRRDPYGGEVYHVRRLGDNIVGYSSKGITLLNPVIDPAVTFGFVELDDVGLINRGAMDGNLRRQVYVGTDRILREITNQGIKELGYYQFMDELDNGEDIIVKYDRINKDFYIGNSEKTYLLSPYGLTEIPQHPSAVWTMSSEDDEVIMLPNTVDTFVPSIITSTFDMGYRGQKTIQSVESNALLTFGPRALVGWANSLAVWGYTTTVPLNIEGIAAITASGNDFMIQLNFDYVAVPSPIQYIKVRYKMTDLRGIRGVYAPPLRGQ